ncbi:MAG TPA: hypothetical protein VK489_03620 [Ferruginibacter sp.]|nr:hypothetical protein [Ferruginibacter sp.]
MGEAELQPYNNLLLVHATLVFYGDAASDALSLQVAKDVEDHWNDNDGKVGIQNAWYRVRFSIRGFYKNDLRDIDVYENTDPRNNYFRIEEYAAGNISFVDGINSNTGYFKLENLLNNSTTAAHEFGHTIGLEHPHMLDIRGKGIPGIMYPRGTLVDPEFQYSPQIPAGEKGGTMNPFHRKVLQADIDDLHLYRLDFDRNGFAMVGDFSSVWHEKQES